MNHGGRDASRKLLGAYAARCRKNKFIKTMEITYVFTWNLISNGGPIYRDNIGVFWPIKRDTSVNRTQY